MSELVLQKGDNVSGVLQLRCCRIRPTAALHGAPPEKGGRISQDYIPKDVSWRKSALLYLGPVDRLDRNDPHWRKGTEATPAVKGHLGYLLVDLAGSNEVMRCHERDYDNTRWGIQNASVTKVGLRTLCSGAGKCQ